LKGPTFHELKEKKAEEKELLLSPNNNIEDINVDNPELTSAPENIQSHSIINN
jgi:hypothetical protein